MKNKGILLDFSHLIRLPVIIPVSLTAFTAYFLVIPSAGISIFMITLAVILLAAAASALNQVQEIRTDRLMERTVNRPLPAGRMTISIALVLVFLCVFTGSLLLYFFGNTAALLTGLFTLAWYNFIYTPLKSRTAFAVIPGALTGALPPVIGWVSAGGSLTDRGIIMLAVMFFMAQVPHFWLLLLQYGNQYRNAGLPSLTSVFSKTQISRLTLAWVTASVISALVLTHFGLVVNPNIKIAVAVLSVFVLIFFSIRTREKMWDYGKIHFIILNAYFLFIMIFLITDKLIRM